ncbi:hypothetical protein Ciccas_000184 [Cichlidogyrus casuarinus]|uniref:protein-tyrosine-phosphatase n=1 Tax=Cichlidogyrus casuarinus TaxID=1844966 RepID=A0ABD2QNQ3_9PLAT
MQYPQYNDPSTGSDGEEPEPQRVCFAAPPTKSRPSLERSNAVDYDDAGLLKQAKVKISTTHRCSSFPSDESTAEQSFLLPGLGICTNLRYSSSHNALSPKNAPDYQASPLSAQNSLKEVLSLKISRILSFLYIGNEHDSLDETLLKSLGITHIINVTRKLQFLDEKQYNCLRLPVSDNAEADLKPYFGEAIRFIDEARKAGKNVLVHCKAGISRSPAVVMAYLMMRSSLNLKMVYRLVKSRRRLIAPHLSFIVQLSELEEEMERGMVEKRPNCLKSEGLTSVECGKEDQEPETGSRFF